MQAGIATALTQPLDVLKTRAMNAKPGEFKNLLAIAAYTAKLGPLGFFKVYYYRLLLIHFIKKKIHFCNGFNSMIFITQAFGIKNYCI